MEVRAAEPEAALELPRAAHRLAAAAYPVVQQPPDLPPQVVSPDTAPVPAGVRRSPPGPAPLSPVGPRSRTPPRLPRPSPSAWRSPRGEVPRLLLWSLPASRTGPPPD